MYSLGDVWHVVVAFIALIEPVGLWVIHCAGWRFARVAPQVTHAARLAHLRGCVVPAEATSRDAGLLGPGVGFNLFLRLDSFQFFRKWMCWHINPLLHDMNVKLIMRVYASSGDFVLFI